MSFIMDFSNKFADFVGVKELPKKRDKKKAKRIRRMKKNSRKRNR